MTPPLRTTWPKLYRGKGMSGHERPSGDIARDRDALRAALGRVGRAVEKADSILETLHGVEAAARGSFNPRARAGRDQRTR